MDFLDDGADVGGERISGLATGCDGAPAGFVQAGTAEFDAAASSGPRRATCWRAQHIAAHPEDEGRTVKDFNWILRMIVRWP